MNIALWVAQALLAVAFFMAGLMKLTQPKEKLAPNMPYVEDISTSTLRGIGLLEVLGAIGVIAPMLLGILPVLTAWAAVGLALTMVGAAIVHIRRKEYPNLLVNFVLFGAAVFVAWGRWL